MAGVRDGRCVYGNFLRSTFLYAAFGTVHAFGDVCMFHVLAVPGEADIAFSIYHDQAACAGSFGSEKSNSCCSGITGSFSMRNKVSGTFSYQQAGEVFAVTGAGDCGIVVGIEAAAN